ncbi:hypothetical protein H6F67_03180 [Microcoleus sp. FACHB-1515]|uniref:YiaA/YiaB family inner membrane protein n=1 Tax=Cyanophyceae TaxID=3028117 RepID=UPI0016835A02|nr:YiaA/YiaB family inner membrane protein [Microcoleus sp. FACHB-1515]MBD2088857.1 hypothetical protein [Microcoleus sp. FACHB-1515]
MAAQTRTNQLISAQPHSTAWVIQTWASFILAVGGMGIGIVYLPVNGWTKGYLGMGLAFTVGSTLSLAKTTRDRHEADRLTSRIDEARVEKILSEHHPLK